MDEPLENVIMAGMLITLMGVSPMKDSQLGQLLPN